MAILILSDGQTVDTTKIEKVDVFPAAGDLLITLKDDGTFVKVHGSGVTDDADVLDETRDRENLSYGVFRRVGSR